MRTAFIDVLMEIPIGELLDRPDAERVLVEAMREKADRTCREAGAELRTDYPPEFQISRGAHKWTHVDVFLCASRWAVTVPENVRL